MTLSDKKITLVHKILSFNKESMLDLADKVVNQIQDNHNDQLGDLQFYVDHIENIVDIEKIKKEQSIKLLSMIELDALIDEANFTESIDDLLSSLK